MRVRPCLLAKCAAQTRPSASSTPVRRVMYRREMDWAVAARTIAFFALPQSSGPSSSGAPSPTSAVLARARPASCLMAGKKRLVPQMSSPRKLEETARVTRCPCDRKAAAARRPGVVPPRMRMCMVRPF